ncbi:MAG: metallophosphatase domain-containing protein [Rikenellaceae bacterium]
MYRLNYKNTEIVFISDTHGAHRSISLEPCDILIHLGDVCNFGNVAEIEDFMDWFASQVAQTKIIVAGNHDAEFAKGLTAFSEFVPEDIALLDNCKAAILCDKEGAEEITLATVPVRLKGIGREWVDLEDVDILLTHCPPRGMLDGKNHYGSRRLLEHVTKYKPKYHFFGHVHFDEPREQVIDGTTFVNVTRKY